MKEYDSFLKMSIAFAKVTIYHSEEILESLCDCADCNEIKPALKQSIIDANKHIIIANDLLHSHDEVEEYENTERTTH